MKVEAIHKITRCSGKVGHFYISRKQREEPDRTGRCIRRGRFLVDGKPFCAHHGMQYVWKELVKDLPYPTEETPRRAKWR
jgi:hypothetical protein